MMYLDNKARAVIVVGIPYPYLHDTKLIKKKEFNTRFAVSKGLLTGSEWYQIQAFRALNQCMILFIVLLPISARKMHKTQE